MYEEKKHKMYECIYSTALNIQSLNNTRNMVANDAGWFHVTCWFHVANVHRILGNCQIYAFLDSKDGESGVNSYRN